MNIIPKLTVEVRELFSKHVDQMLEPSAFAQRHSTNTRYQFSKYLVEKSIPNLLMIIDSILTYAFKGYAVRTFILTIYAPFYRKRRENKIKIQSSLLTNGEMSFVHTKLQA
jgi:hypothetical protein